jgi:phosphatidylserine/phosphatidylglycerophosphate/cardiolipin synthase-like enzyme
MKTSIDLGQKRVGGGYFLLRQKHRPAAFAGALQSVADPVRFCFTYQQSHRSIEEELLKLIRNARQKLFITSFRIGDRKVFQALVEAAKRLQGGVYVITALDERSIAEGIAETDEDATDPKAGIASLKKDFYDMTIAGIYVRGHSSCHAKFAVADDNVALVTSANFETRAFQETGECGVVVQTPLEVRRLARLFTRLWHSGCDWEMAPGAASLVQQRQSERSPCSVPLPTASENAVIWTDHAERLILEHLHGIIAGTKRELLLASFSLCGMREHPELLLAPIEKLLKKRKVDVRLIIRGRNNVRGHREDARLLHELGVSVFADHLNHAKGVIADRTAGALFSANFDAKHGLTSGVETGMRIDGTAALADATSYFEHAINNASLEFVCDPTQRVMDERFACRWRRPWSFPAKLRLKCTDAAWNQFVEKAESGPVLYERQTDSQVALYAGDSSWKLTISDKGSSKLDVGVPGKAAGILLEDWLSSRKDANEVRGFCPAQVQKAV